MKELLRRYLDVRLEYRTVAVDRAELAGGLRVSAEIQKALWTHAEAAARASPTPVVVSFITALNELIDTDAERLAAARNRMPSTVWMLVVFVGAFGCFTSGHGSGAQGARSNFTSFLLPLLLTFVIALIFDIDSSLQGTIDISQQPMLELKASLAR